MISCWRDGEDWRISKVGEVEVKGWGFTTVGAMTSQAFLPLCGRSMLLVVPVIQARTHAGGALQVQYPFFGIVQQTFQHQYLSVLDEMTRRADGCA